MEQSNSDRTPLFGEVGKATGISLIFTLAAVLLFAFIIKIVSLDTSVIKPVNQFLKVISIFTGCYFSLNGRKGWIKGMLTGFFVILLTYFIFAIISGSIEFNWSVVLEIIFGSIIGGISGIITVNLKK